MDVVILIIVRSVQYHLRDPEVRPGISSGHPLSGISGLPFDSSLLSFFCLVVLLLFLSGLFAANGPLS